MVPESTAPVRRKGGTEMRMLWEAQDAARRLDLSADSVRALERAGALPVAARTPRGVRLFDPAAVKHLSEERSARRRGSGRR